MVCGIHNHPTAEHFEGHSYIGRLSQEELSLVIDMSKSMAQPYKDILFMLERMNPRNVTTLRTICIHVEHIEWEIG